MLFACTYVQSNHFVRKTCEIKDKILNHVQTQSKMMEVVKNTRNGGMYMMVNQKIHYLWGCWLVNDSACLKSMWFKKTLISTDCSMVRELHHQSMQLEFPCNAISSLPSRLNTINSVAPSCLFDDAERWIVTFSFQRRLTWNFTVVVNRLTFNDIWKKIQIFRRVPIVYFSWKG